MAALNFGLLLLLLSKHLFVKCFQNDLGSVGTVQSDTGNDAQTNQQRMVNKMENNNLYTFEQNDSSLTSSNRFHYDNNNKQDYNGQQFSESSVQRPFAPQEQQFNPQTMEFNPQMERQEQYSKTTQMVVPSYTNTQNQSPQVISNQLDSSTSKFIQHPPSTVQYQYTNQLKNRENNFQTTASQLPQTHSHGQQQYKLQGNPTLEDGQGQSYSFSYSTTPEEPQNQISTNTYQKSTKFSDLGQKPNGGDYQTNKLTLHEPYQDSNANTVLQESDTIKKIINKNSSTQNEQVFKNQFSPRVATINSQTPETQKQNLPTESQFASDVHPQLPLQNIQQPNVFSNSLSSKTEPQSVKPYSLSQYNQDALPINTIVSNTKLSDTVQNLKDGDNQTNKLIQVLPSSKQYVSSLPQNEQQNSVSQFSTAQSQLNSSSQDHQNILPQLSSISIPSSQLETETAQQPFHDSDATVFQESNGTKKIINKKVNSSTQNEISPTITTIDTHTPETHKSKLPTETQFATVNPQQNIEQSEIPSNLLSSQLNPQSIKLNSLKIQNELPINTNESLKKLPITNTGFSNNQDDNNLINNPVINLDSDLNNDTPNVPSKTLQNHYNKMNNPQAYLINDTNSLDDTQKSSDALKPSKDDDDDRNSKTINVTHQAQIGSPVKTEINDYDKLPFVYVVTNYENGKSETGNSKKVDKDFLNNMPKLVPVQFDKTNKNDNFGNHQPMHTSWSTIPPLPNNVGVQRYDPEPYQHESKNLYFNNENPNVYYKMPTGVSADVDRNQPNLTDNNEYYSFKKIDHQPYGSISSSPVPTCPLKQYRQQNNNGYNLNKNSDTNVLEMTSNPIRYNYNRQYQVVSNPSSNNLFAQNMMSIISNAFQVPVVGTKSIFDVVRSNFPNFQIMQQVSMTYDVIQSIVVGLRKSLNRIVNNLFVRRSKRSFSPFDQLFNVFSKTNSIVQNLMGAQDGAVMKNDYQLNDNYYTTNTLYNNRKPTTDTNVYNYNDWSTTDFSPDKFNDNTLHQQVSNGGIRANGDSPGDIFRVGQQMESPQQRFVKDFLADDIKIAIDSNLPKEYNRDSPEVRQFYQQLIAVIGKSFENQINNVLQGNSPNMNMALQRVKTYNYSKEVPIY